MDVKQSCALWNSPITHADRNFTLPPRISFFFFLGIVLLGWPQDGRETPERTYWPTQ